MTTAALDRHYSSSQHRERYERVARLMPAVEWDAHYELVAAVDALKHERNAVILAHNYQRPEVYHGVADFCGDSLELARYAARATADVIVLCERVIPAYRSCAT